MQHSRYFVVARPNRELSPGILLRWSRAALLALFRYLPRFGRQSLPLFLQRLGQSAGTPSRVETEDWRSVLFSIRPVHLVWKAIPLVMCPTWRHNYTKRGLTLFSATLNLQSLRSGFSEGIVLFSIALVFFHTPIHTFCTHWDPHIYPDTTPVPPRVYMVIFIENRRVTWALAWILAITNALLSMITRDSVVVVAADTNAIDRSQRGVGLRAASQVEILDAAAKFIV